MKKRLFAILGAAVTAAASVPAFQLSTGASQLPDDWQDHMHGRGCNLSNSGSYNMSANADGSVNCGWNGISECTFGNSCFRKGQQLAECVSVSEITAADFTYQAELEASGLCYYGIAGVTRNPRCDFQVVEGWSTWRPPVKDQEPLKTVEINGAEYDIYLTKRMGYDDLDHFKYPVFWSIRRENTYTADEKNTLSGTVPLTEHFKVWESLEEGLNPDTLLEDLFFELYAYGTEEVPAYGTCLMKPMECTLKQKSGAPLTMDADAVSEAGEGLKDLFAPYFRLNADIPESMFGSYQEYPLLYRKEFGSLTMLNTLDPDKTVMDVDAENVKMHFGAASGVLAAAEKYKIALNGSALLTNAVMMPETMFDCTPEVGQARIENIIKQTFSYISENYPNVDLYAYTVCDRMKSKERQISSGYGWDAVFGGDDDYIVNAFKAARQYAPEGCKLYLGDDLEGRDVFALAKKIQAAGDYIDGISLSALYGDEFPADELEEKIQQCIALGLEVQLTDVAFSGVEDYQAEGTGELWKQFFTLALKYADHISAVTFREPVDNPYLYDSCSRGLFGCRFVDGGFRVEMEPHQCYQDIVDMMKKLPADKNRNGDANCDGSVDVADAVLILRFAVGDAEAEISDQGVKNGDADKNGQTDGDDAALILRAIAKQVRL